MIRYSRQRDSIRNYLMGRTDHPTAEMIYTALRAEDPRLSLGTVYRNLSLLVQMGEIRRITPEDGPDYYDGNLSPHCHFICRSCRKVTDLYIDGLDDYLTGISSQIHGRVDETQFHFYGICEECQNRTHPAL